MDVLMDKFKISKQAVIKLGEEARALDDGIHRMERNKADMLQEIEDYEKEIKEYEERNLELAQLVEEEKKLRQEIKDIDEALDAK